MKRALFLVFWEQELKTSRSRIPSELLVMLIELFEWLIQSVVLLVFVMELMVSLIQDDPLDPGNFK